MASRAGRRVLPIVYLVVVSALFGVLIGVGFALDRLPLLPRVVSRGYQRGLLALVSGLARPSDGWAEPSAEPVAGAVPGESAP